MTRKAICLEPIEMEVELPELLKHYDLSGDFREIIPQFTDHPLYHIELPFPEEDIGKRFIAWAANPSSSEGVEAANVAYDGCENYCVSEICKRCGKVIGLVQIAIPQLTRRKGEVFPLQVHCLKEASYAQGVKERKWSEEVQTYPIIPKILYKTVQEMTDKKVAILINALPREDFEKNTILGSISIPLGEHEKLSEEEREQSFIKIIRKEQLKHPQLLDLNVDEIPLIVFCAHEKCDASEELAKLLAIANFKKILEYSGGQKDYDEKSGKLLDDTSSDEEEKEESDLESDEEEEPGKAEPAEPDFKQLTKLGEEWVSSAIEDMKNRKKNNESPEEESPEEEESSEEESPEEESPEEEESSEEEPEVNQDGGSRRRKRRGRKRRRRAITQLRGGAWCFSFM